MKRKVIISILILSFTQTLSAQVSDTTAYLRDSICGNKSYFVGKPLRVLLTELKIGVTQDITYVSYQAGMADSTQLSRVDFLFNSSLNILQNAVNSPVLCVRFSPVKVPSIYFKAGHVLSWLDRWKPSKKYYFSGDQFIVTDIQLY